MRAAPRGGEDEHDHDHARLPKGQRMKLALSGRDYEYLFGAQADTERREAQKARSARAGKQAARLSRIRSSLENFIPEVRPGNQTALNTRAAPFAAFIAAMHRSIHSLWGFGILEDWDELGGGSPLNDEKLMSNLEIVLNGDGSVDKVTVVQGSKYLPFDVAAIDVAYSAGPYPMPPREIRSGNGKIYIHWRFFRDGHQCATSGVDYFILDNRGKDDDRPLEEGAARTSSAANPALHRLSRGGGATEEEGVRGGDNESVSSHGSPGAADEAAKRQATAWWTAFVHGDVGAVAARSALPFRAGETVTVKSPDELLPMLRNLLEETPSRGARGFDVLTGAGLRKIMGRLPSGFDDGSGRLFVLVRTSGDSFILRLAPVTNGDWRVDGLLRR
jgi:TonB family protein